ncbi:MAG TPA: hypothetical protein VMD91_02505 [Candidatus Sulfotelmatobacter sp.]|nr:hypothetical protein [Candidatus Sulfotelmatobacter sp.]
MPLSALAQGEVRIEQHDGSNTLYPGVRIGVAADTVTFTLPNSQHAIVVTGKDCHRENGVRVCDGAEVWFDRYGVNEELRLTKAFVFINDTHRELPIKGSRVELSPNTLLVEILTKRGTYITGRGWVDSSGGK